MTDEDKKLILGWLGAKQLAKLWQFPDGLITSLRGRGIWYFILFEYAVPKLVTEYGLDGITFYLEDKECKLDFELYEVWSDSAEDFAEAFGQALLKLIKDKDKDK